MRYGKIESDDIVIGNDNYLKSRNYEGTSDLDVIKINSDNQINFGSTVSEIKYNTNTSPSGHVEGRVFYDNVDKTLAMQTFAGDVTLQIGQEMHRTVFNNSGMDIDNGQIVYGNGNVSGYTSIHLAIASDTVSRNKIIGMATTDIANNELGIITTFGKVRDVDTSSCELDDVLYLSNSVSGGFITSFPPAPNNVIKIGNVSIVDSVSGAVNFNIDYGYSRTNLTKSYTFSSRGVGAGTYYEAGFYDAPVTSTTRTQTALTITYGETNLAKGAHAFIVAGGVGTVNTGQVGIRVTGTSITDTGVRTASDTETLTTNITTLSTNLYLETTKKWIGIITYSLYTVSGTPTTYSATFNYGFAKYEDFGNQNFTLMGTEVVGLAGANDTAFDVQVLKHTNTGWTYSAAAFNPGSGVITSLAGTYVTERALVNNKKFAWKRTGLLTPIEGSGEEGVIIKIICNANNSVQYMDLHLGVLIDSGNI